MKRIAFCLLAALSIAQIAHGEDKKKKKEPAPTALDLYLTQARQANAATAPASGSLFSANNPNLFFYRDPKARTTNDIVTISIIENNTGSNTTNTTTSKSGAVGVTAPGFFGLEKGNAALNFTNILQGTSNLSFAGAGTASQTGAFTASLSARVIEVLPNGNLVIQGTKDVTIAKEHQSMVIRGVIRTTDIAPTNVVLSTSIADMEVSFEGKGIVSNANKPGWLYWLFTKILPF